MKLMFASSGPKTSFLPAGMRQEEYDRLQELVLAQKPTHTLEVGMAHGGSSVLICEALREFGRGKHVAIDPFQTAAEGWKGQGMERIRERDLADWLELIEDYDYLALPRLVEEGRSFDFILIDGWHSFDYAMLDYFYADLLLRPGGILAFHDSGYPSVYRVCRFVETHKPYERLSPAPSVRIPSLIGRLGRRVGQLLGGPAAMREARARRSEWFSLCAYRKKESRQVPNDFSTAF
jgi:hypothetical protein